MPKGPSPRNRILTFSSFLKSLAISIAPVIVRPKAAVATGHKSWRTLASSTVSVVTAMDSRNPSAVV